MLFFLKIVYEGFFLWELILSFLLLKHWGN